MVSLFYIGLNLAWIISLILFIQTQEKELQKFEQEIYEDMMVSK